MPLEIDYARLHKVQQMLMIGDDDTRSARGVGKTFARIHLMLLHSRLSPPLTNYLFVAPNHNAAHGLSYLCHETAHREFQMRTDIHQRESKVADVVSGNQFHFIGLSQFDITRMRGMRWNYTVFVDVDELHAIGSGQARAYNQLFDELIRYNFNII